VVADAIADPATNPLRTVSPRIYSAESRRTDKQIGSSSGSSGSTTLVEKAGVPDLLSFAIENGAIQQEMRGTNVTLSTSPYAMLMLQGRQTQSSYERYGFWRRIGISASFPLDASESDSLGRFDPRAISEWSFSFRILGDRSTRSRKFNEEWDSIVSPKIVNYLKARQRIFKSLFTGDMEALDESAKNNTESEVQAYLSTSDGSTDQEKIEHISGLILNHLSNDIRDSLIQGRVTLSDSTRDVFLNELIPDLIAAQATYEGVDADIEQLTEKLSRTFLLTFKFTNHRELVGTNYSDLKLLADGFIDPFDVLLNAGIALNHDPDAALNQSTIREFSFSGSIQAHFDNMFSNRFNRQNVSRITLSGSGKYVRLENVDGDMGIFQAKLDIPFSSGFSIPFSVTYSTRTELIDESDIRGNFGITLDLDKLYAAARSSLEQ